MKLRASDKPESTWHRLKMATIEAANKTIGYKKKKRTDWFDSNNDELQDLLRKKHDAYAKLQQIAQSFHAQQGLSRTEKDNSVQITTSTRSVVERSNKSPTTFGR